MLPQPISMVVRPFEMLPQPISMVVRPFEMLRRPFEMVAGLFEMSRGPFEIVTPTIESGPRRGSRTAGSGHGTRRVMFGQRVAAGETGGAV
jgi:hypothetical protein